MVQDYFKDDYYVKFRLTGQDKYLYWKILEREPFRYDTSYNNEFSSTAAGANTGDITFTYLEPADNELYYQIPAFKDGCEYELRIPVGNDRFGVAQYTKSGVLTNEDSPYFAPNPQWGFFTAIKTKFSVKATNVTPESLTPYVKFEGMKYRIEVVTDQKLIDDLVSGKEHSTKLDFGGFTK